MKRVLSPSSSNVRREEQVPDQACSSLRASDPSKDGERIGVAMSEDSSSDDPFPTKRGRAKRRKRTLPSTTPSVSEAEMRSDTGKEERRKSENSQIPPPSKASKRLPSVDERLAVIRNTPSAILADSILEVADSLERVAATSGNLKDTYVRRLRDDAGKVRANAIELAKRTDTTAAMAALEQENIQLRARLQKADQEIESLKVRQEEKNDKDRGNHSKVPPTVNRARPTAAPEGDKLVESSVRTEIRALTEQIQALRELVFALMRGDRPIGQNEFVRREPASSGMERPPNAREDQTKVREQAAQKKARDQRRAEPQARSMPAAAVDPATTWVKVVGRKEKAAKKKAEKAAIRKDTAPRVEWERGQRPTPKGTRMGEKLKVNPPRRAAVAISLAPGSAKTSGEVLATARAKIRLPEIGVPVAKIRQTMAGGILIEIPGQESSAKADNLAIKLKEVFAEEREIRISRPSKRTEIRICGLDASIQPSEVKERVAAEGGCNVDEVKVGEILKRSPRGLGAAWVQCPVLAAKALADKGKIVIGWVSARVEVLRARPMTCFRCFERGHTASSCTSKKDRSGHCYNCGEAGHRARECTWRPPPPPSNVRCAPMLVRHRTTALGAGPATLRRPVKLRRERRHQPEKFPQPRRERSCNRSPTRCRKAALKRPWS